MKKNQTPLAIFGYPARFAREPDGSAVNVAFRDLPEALTFAADFREALSMARDCLQAAIGWRISADQDIPPPSAPEEGEVPIQLPVLLAAKAALHLALREAGISKLALARALGLSEVQVRRMLNPRQNSRIESMEEALAALGRALVVGVR